MMDRRAFLATPLVFGLPELLAQEPAGRPAWLEDALRRMKATRRCGLAFVVPETGTGRRSLGETLYALLESDLPAARMLLAETVLLCLPRTLARPLFGVLEEGGDRLLVSPDGKLISADRAPLDAQDGMASLVSSCRELVFGRGRERLKEAVAEPLAEPTRRLIERLGGLDVEDGERAFRELSADVDSMPLRISALRLSENPRLADGARRLLLEFVQRHRKGEVAVGLLPYGARLPRFMTVSCGGEILEAPAPPVRLPACGLVQSGRLSRRFLAFLAP